MKKLLCTAVILMLPTLWVNVSAKADYPVENAPYFSYDNVFYIKAHSGVVSFSPIKSGDIKIKSPFAPVYGLGLGYYITSDFRADVTFEHYNNPIYKHFIKGYYDEDIATKAKGKINSLMLNMYADLFEINSAKIYAGAGVGAALVQAKFFKRIIDRKANIDISGTSSSKLSTNFVYSFTLGAAIPISKSTNIDINYYWKNFDKTKSKRDEFGDETTSIFRYKGHVVSVGVRLDI